MVKIMYLYTTIWTYSMLIKKKRKKKPEKTFVTQTNI